MRHTLGIVDGRWLRDVKRKRGIVVCDAPLIGPVENIGLEPMTSCMPCKRSSQLS